MTSPGPSVVLLVSSISSSLKLRQAHDTARRCLRGAKVDFTERDLASDEAAKSLWKRKSQGPADLPLILVDGERPGSVEQLEEAVEFGELRQFLGLDRPQKRGGQDDLGDLTEEDATKLLAEMEQNGKPASADPVAEGVQ